MKTITLAHSDLTKTIYAIIGKEKIDITNQAIAEVKAIKALEQEPKAEWISVKDNMPVIGEEVLVCDLDGDMYITYLHTDGRWGFDYDGDKIKNVIAWQPLPKPYKGSEGEQFVFEISLERKEEDADE